MKQVTIILLHVGSGPLPDHLHETLEVTSQIASKSRIIFISNDSNRKSLGRILQGMELKKLPPVEFVAIEEIPESQNSKKFRELSNLNRTFRNGFWFNASDRFFVLADYMHSQGIENVVHIENDYVLYFDPTDKFDAFESHADFAVPLDRVRAIPGIVWLKNSFIANKLAESIVENPNQDDMMSIGKFCIDNLGSLAKPLPTIPFQYTLRHSLNLEKYSSGIDEFGGIFDAAAVGQYLGGVDRMNDPSDTTFFINESSDLKMSDFSFSWEIKYGIKAPLLTYQNETTAVLGLHMHCKKLNGVSPFNHGVPFSVSDLVTGERIQALCDVTVSAPSITKFHGRENIHSKALLELPEDNLGNLMPPTDGLIKDLLDAKTIFVYTHLVPYFGYYIAPRINAPFNLVTHNSDHPVTIMDFQLLNHPYLRIWYAQNCQFSHSKLKPLPIGLENSQWGPEKLKLICSTGERIIKKKSLYVNFSIQTHPSRAEALSIAKKLNSSTIESGVSYETYLKGLADHKFCICPRGNGIDTHRFWEAQYLDCIPIILSRDWTPSYSSMPILILDEWRDLEGLDLELMYIKISNKQFSREGLSLAKISGEILGD